LGCYDSIREVKDRAEVGKAPGTGEELERISFYNTNNAYNCRGNVPQ
jgi:hypothetical protein